MHPTAIPITRPVLTLSGGITEYTVSKENTNIIKYTYRVKHILVIHTNI